MLVLHRKASFKQPSAYLTSHPKPKHFIIYDYITACKPALNYFVILTTNLIVPRRQERLPAGCMALMRRIYFPQEQAGREKKGDYLSDMDIIKLKKIKKIEESALKNLRHLSSND